MYEEISIKRRIDWKSLLTKTGILLIVVFIICAIAFSPKKTYAITPLNEITSKLLSVGKEYFTFDLLPINLGDEKSITLNDLIEKELIDQKDYENNKCDYNNSYIKVTKVDNTEFSIYATVLCNKTSDIVIDTIKTKQDTLVNDTNNDSLKVEVIE